MSIDSMFVHKMWDDHELAKMVDGGVPFPMLSDAGGKVGKLFGVYNEGAGVENRGRFIIDPDGVVQGYEVLTPPVGRNVMESFRQVQAFQLVREIHRQEIERYFGVDVEDVVGGNEAGFDRLGEMAVDG